MFRQLIECAQQPVEEAGGGPRHVKGGQLAQLVNQHRHQEDGQQQEEDQKDGKDDDCADGARHTHARQQIYPGAKQVAENGRNDQPGQHILANPEGEDDANQQNDQHRALGGCIPARAGRYFALRGRVNRRRLRQRLRGLVRLTCAGLVERHTRSALSGAGTAAWLWLLGRVERAAATIRTPLRTCGCALQEHSAGTSIPFSAPCSRIAAGKNPPPPD